MGRGWGERNQYMLETLKTCDWLWFMGTDTLAMNHTIDVRQFLDDQFDFIIGKDLYGINNDVFFLKNNSRSIEFLERVIACNQSHVHDQEAMSGVMAQMPELKASVVSQKLFNAYLFKEYGRPLGEGNFEIGDFVLHLPGLPNERRIEIMKEYLPRVIK